MNKRVFKGLYLLRLIT